MYDRSRGNHLPQGVFGHYPRPRPRMCPIKIRIEVYFNTNPRRRFQFRANNSPGPKGTTKNPPLKNRTYTEYPGQLRKTWSVISTPPPHLGHIAFATSRL